MESSANLLPRDKLLFFQQCLSNHYNFANLDQLSIKEQKYHNHHSKKYFASSA